MTDCEVGPYELRARRVACSALGVALLVYSAADLIAAHNAPAVLSHGWWIASLAGRLIFGVALVTIPWLAGAAALRLLALSFAAFGIVMVSVSLIANDTDLIWTQRAQSLYVWAAPLALRPVQAWAWILVFELLAGIARAMRSTNLFGFLGSSLVALTLTVLLISVLLVFLRVSRARDLQEQSVLRAIREDAYQAVSAEERRRIERIVHDEVLSTLRATSLGLRTDRADPAMLASAALSHLAALDKGPDERATPVDADTLLTHLRSLVTAIAPETEIRTERATAAVVPAQVATAIAEACREALRNSVLHAPSDREPTRVVVVRIGSDAVDVTVDDDGDGFDTRHVPPSRLGIARSIVQRMQALPGGDAKIRSTVRSGTSVTMNWHG